MSASHPPDPDRRKAIVRRLFVEVWMQAEFKHLSELVSPLTYHLRGYSFVQVPENLSNICEKAGDREKTENLLEPALPIHKGLRLSGTPVCL